MLREGDFVDQGSVRFSRWRVNETLDRNTCNSILTPQTVHQIIQYLINGKVVSNIVSRVKTGVAKGPN